MNESSNKRISLPKDVKRIIGILSENGYEAYAVGGCVRDSLLGRTPGDWDITTSALPGQVKSLFRRTIDTGIQHGTVTVMLGDTGYEVTTYRLDGVYEDLRHPKEVEFTSNLVEDLKRRDFTINAMAYNDEQGIVDAFDGMGDIKQGIIRCVGNARDRFGEDALRILRAVRFCAQLGFAIEESTAEAVVQLAANLDRISKERIHTELNKMLKSVHPEYFLMADELGIMKVILPEYHALGRNQKEFAGKLAGHCACELPERYAAMFLFAGTDCDTVRLSELRPGEAAETARTVLRGLKMDNDTISMTQKLLLFCSMELTEDEAVLRHLIHDAGTDCIMRILEFRLAYEKTMSDTISDSGTDNCTDGLETSGAGTMCNRVIRQSTMCRMILDRGDCVSLKGLAITGRELIGLGIPAGRSMGTILDALLEAVLNDRSINNKPALSAMALELAGKTSIIKE